MKRMKALNIKPLVNLLAVLVVLLGCSIQIRSLLSGNLLALAPLGFYIILIYLFIRRKPSKDAVSGWKNWLFALCGTYGPFFLQPAPTSVVALKYLGIGTLAFGIAVTFIAISSLGRGFGIIAANRDIKTHGAYHFIRHPLYLGEELWFLALILQNLNVYNIVLFILQISCQLMRIRTEEALLRQDEQYRRYMESVKYRLIPGIY